MALEKGKKILGLVAGGIMLYAGYKILFGGKKPVQAVEQATKEVVSAPVKAVAKLVKGSPEAKKFMADLRKKRKPSKSMTKKEHNKDYKTENWKF